MKIHDVEQRSEAWFQLRSGKLTGSAAKDMLAKVKAGEAAARRNLKYKLIAERLTGQAQRSTYVNAAMEWGTAHEAEAIAAYEAATGAMVQAIGFVEHDEQPIGTSPDGFVGDDGIVSIKCPETANHIGYLRSGVEPSEHAAQNTHELWLTGRAWVDFVSYDPRLPEDLRLFVLRVTRTPEQLSNYASQVKAFLGEIDNEIAALRTIKNLRAVLTEVA
ncbi:MAG: YqaJ viral recombinase family protein [Acidobacteria bacterium]|nr:YqaJ viral recombinase family protein [Acidobacteriota bacterium]